MYKDEQELYLCRKHNRNAIYIERITQILFMHIE